MHFSPQQVREMSLWQFWAAADGVSKAHKRVDAPEQGSPMTTAKFDAMFCGGAEPLNVSAPGGVSAFAAAMREGG